MSKPPATVPAIELRGIDKRFGTVHANRNIDLTVARGSVHGIVGENGAGKSTLMNILYGFYRADRGEILIGGTPTSIGNAFAAISAGIGMVHQHFMLVDTFTVLENIILGAEGGPLLASGVAKARAELARLAREYALDIALDAMVGDLPVGQQQRVEILKALYRGADILILDEPTGVLTPQEADHLFRILRLLRDQGKTIILITHKLREIMAVTDVVSVMRQGSMVAHRQTSETSMEELAELMVGRRVLLCIDKSPAKPGREVLRIERLRVLDSQGIERVKGISLSIHAGEIVGVAGVSGNGQSELLEAIAGIRPIAGGQVVLNGQPVATAHHGHDPRTLRHLGVAHIPEDRHRMGLILPFEACESAILGYQDERKYNIGLFLDHRTIVADTAVKMGAFDVRPSDPHMCTANFSGGNQQKIVLAREIEHDPDLLLVGQPTRGIDIGAIEAIHRRLIAMRDAGKAILLVSAELDEIRSLADRILVMSNGHIVGEVAEDRADEGQLGLMMAGVAPSDSVGVAP